MKLSTFALCLLFAFSLHAQEESSFPEYKFINGIMLDNGEETFSAHQPNYIIGGQEDLKLQISLKYRILKEIPLFFSYTQRMFWQIYKKSKPFKDINFQPELFYRFILREKYLRSIDVGVLHYSNGKDESASRSYNQIYSSFNILNYHNEYVNFASVAQLFYTFDKDATNEDIVNYIGHYKVHFGFFDVFNRQTQNLDVGLSVFAGDHLVNFDRGALELDLKYSLLKKYINPDVLFQYYHGYAENLINYDKSVDHFRIGFIFYL